MQIVSDSFIWVKPLTARLHSEGFNSTATVLVLADSFGAIKLSAQLQQCEGLTPGILIGWPARTRILLGPLLRKGSRPCKDCLLAWLALYRPHERAIGSPSKTKLELLVRELRHWRKRPSAFIGRISEVDLQSGLRTWHPIATRPNCPCSQDESTTIPRNLVNPVTGLVSSLNSFHRSGVWFAAAEVATPPSPNPIHLSASGVGTSRSDAELRCLFESIERYSLVPQGTGPVTVATAQQMWHQIASKPALYPFSDTQYAKRDEWNRQHLGVPYIPAKLPVDIPIQWSRCWSLDNARQAWLPAELIGNGEPSSEGYFVCDSVGCAASSDLEQAMLNALLEAVERDAVAIWWYNRIQRPAVSADKTSPEVHRLHRFLKLHNRDYCLLDITTDLGIPVFAGVSWNPRGTRPAMGFGCHPDTRIAMNRALRELCQTSIGAAADRAARYPITSPEHAFLRWAQQTRVFDHPHLQPAGNPQDLPAVPGLQVLPTKELLRLILGVLRAAGIQAWIVPLTRPELGIPVMRVIAGELRHPGHRLAPGRLYDVPVKLGWRDRPHLESEMNPAPCIF